jgi:predicted nucleic acid-binding protein
LILVDTSIWVDHLRRGNAELVGLLQSSRVLMHPFIVGEIACGSLAKREATLELLSLLPMAAVAEPDEALGFIEVRALHGKGIGYVDVHLLASTALTSGCTLWTGDKRLVDAATSLAIAYAVGRR